MENIKKPYVIVLLNLVVIFGWNWYIKTRIASAKALIESVKLNANDFTEKEKLIVSMNHINEIGLASNSIFIVSLVLFVLNILFLKFMMKANLWFLKALFFLIVTAFSSFIFFLHMIKNS
ncbi:conserved membrane protein of unknown function [Tenacibaculum sp. 190130A14a]|uniref:Uncharacterized protein n=1 Tax=Tenacibaculum polynesiense TaxID=3137857 RepID=A0ABM9PE76_9FLAO